MNDLLFPLGLQGTLTILQLILQLMLQLILQLILQLLAIRP